MFTVQNLKMTSRRTDGKEDIKDYKGKPRNLKRRLVCKLIYAMVQ
jgi:hypothetical protein